MKLRKKHLSTMHTARIFSNLLVIAGFLIIPFVWFYSEYAAISGGSVVIQSAVDAVDDLAGLQFSLPLTVLISIVTIWAGYVLKTLVVLAETQLHDTSPTA